MLGDVADMVFRMRRVLPGRWFGDLAPAAHSVLTGFGVAWSAIYNLVQTVAAQTRLATASGAFLDLIGVDYFCNNLLRRDGENDDPFRQRMRLEMLRPRGTREALLNAMGDFTGQAAVVFEPARPADTGGYGVGGVGYGAAGGWGNLTLSFQSFLTVKRPHGGGISSLAGYGTGGLVAYGDLAMVATPISDSEIYAAAHRVMPAAYQLWVRIQD